MDRMRRFALLGMLVAVGCGGDDDGGGARPDASATGDAPLPDGPLRVVWESLGTDGPPSRPEPNAGTLNGKVVLFGGRMGTNQFLADTWIWDGTWTQVMPPVSPGARANGVMVELDGVLVLVGGVGRVNDSLEVLGDTWTFDGATWTQVSGATIPIRQSAAGARHGTRAVVAGGSTTSVPRRDDAHAFDPAAGTWTQLPGGFPAHRNGAMVTLDDHAVLIGGSTPGASSSLYRFDDTTWTEIGTLPRGGRAYHGAATLAGRIVVFGGVRTSTNAIAETDAWPGGAEVVGAEPNAQFHPAMVTLSDSVLMLAAADEQGTGFETWRLKVAP